MAGTKKTYQFVLDANECQLFRDLRQLRTASTEVLFDSNVEVENLRISAHAGTRNLGAHEISVSSNLHAIQGFACAGVHFLRKMAEDSNKGDEQVLPKMTGNITGIPDDDLDSVLGSQTGDHPTTATENGVDNLRRVWEKPSFVRKIVFVVDKQCMMDSTCANILRSQFPEAIITDSLRDTTPSSDTIQTRRPEETENAEKKPAVSKEGGDPTNDRLNPIQHLRDLAKYALEPLLDTEFGLDCVSYAAWDLVPYGRKLGIAHARAIQGDYGEKAENRGCDHCAEQGHGCRTYRTPLINLSHMNLGRTCQNCRMIQAPCSLDGLPQQSPATPEPECKSNTRTSVTTYSRRGTRTPPRATSPKLRSFSRVSGSGPNAVANAHDICKDEQDQFEGSTGSLIITEKQRNFIQYLPNGRNSILDVANYIGLELEGPVRNVIHAMGRQWKTDGEVAPTLAQMHNRTHYYSNLVTLYILAYAQMDNQFAYAVLLRFQAMNYLYNSKSDFPGLRVVVRAFEYLPTNTAFCRWIAMLYAFHWDTSNTDDCKIVLKHDPQLDRLALRRFFDTVSQYRGLYPMGYSKALLAHWCDVHDHEEGEEMSWKRDHCKCMRAALSPRNQSVHQSSTARTVQDAHNNIERGCRPYFDREKHGNSNTKRLGKKKKRKADHRDDLPFKKPKYDHYVPNQ